LLATSVKGHASVVLILELDEELVGRLLTFDEDEGASVFLLVEKVSEKLEDAVELALLRTDLDDLSDGVGDYGTTTNGDLERTTENLASESFHLTRESSGEEDGLTVGPDLIDDLHDLR
jgi:hypothetical protein